MTEILLPDNNLAGTLPQTLSNIDWLKVLNLSSNKLSGEFPKCIVKATNLEIVDLSNNNLTGSIPGEISKLIYEKDKVEIKPSLIQLTKEIKTLGTFKVKINLHSEVQSEVSIRVVQEETIQ